MRIKVVHKPPIGSIDGLQLDHFEAGRHYEVGNTIGALMLAEGWAIVVPSDESVIVVPIADKQRADADDRPRRPGPRKQ